DVLQDSLLNAFIGFDRFEGRADLRTWLNRILVNRALDHLRGVRRRPDMHDPHSISDVADVAASLSPDPERLAASADWRRSDRGGGTRFRRTAPVIPPDPGVRSIIRIEIDRVSSSCGYAVPLYRFEAQRTQLAAWADRKGKDGLAKYRR